MKRASFCLLVCIALLFCAASASAFSVSYSEDQSAGSMWHYTISDETVLAVTDEGYNGPEASGDTPGTHRWMIRGLKAGEASVGFTYAWTWEEELPEPDVEYTFASDAAGNLTLLTTLGMPEQYMSGTLTIRLKENPSTGYVWTVDMEPQDSLSLVRSAYEEAASPDTLGAGGVHAWVYQGQVPGTVMLIYRYVHSADTGGTPDAEMKLTLIVRDDLSVYLMGLDGDYSMYVP